MFYIRYKKSSSFKFWLGEVGGGAAAWQPSPWVHPCDCLLLSPCLTCTYNTSNLQQKSTWKNLYCTIKLHVKACNGNYLQLRAMTDICLKKLLKTEILVQKSPRLQAGWCLQVHPLCVDCLYWPCLIFHTSMHILATCVRSVEPAGHNGNFKFWQYTQHIVYTVQNKY